MKEVYHATRDTLESTALSRGHRRDCGNRDPGRLWQRRERNEPRRPTAAAKATAASTPAAASATSAPVAAGSTTAAASTTGSIATAAPAIPANTKFKLTVAIKNNSPAEVDLMQKVVDLYKADRPNADVAVLGYDNATYDQKLLTDISGGTLPDVFTCNDVYNKPFFQNGLIADLKPLAAKTGFKLDDFDPQFLGLADYPGQDRLPAPRGRCRRSLLQQAHVR